MVTEKIKRDVLKVILNLPRGSKFECTMKFWEAHGLSYSSSEVKAIGKYVHQELCPQYLEYDYEGAEYENKKSDNHRIYRVK